MVAILQDQKTFVIAEAGVNHNGSITTALQLVEAAKKAGADAVKFQTFKANKLVTRDALTAEYQQNNTGESSQFAMLKALEMSLDMHQQIIARCHQLQIEFMSTAFDEDSLDLLIKLGVKKIKIPSGEITNFPLLRHAANKNLPIILSTGMSTLSEVRAAVAQFVNKDNLVILHCTSNYPTELSNVNLLAMQTLRNELQLPVGYSDHTAGILISPMAVAMGARIIEKHFTLDKTLPGPDHKASLEPHELKQMIEHIRAVEIALGNAEKKPCQSEIPVRNLVRKSITLKHHIEKGKIIEEKDLLLLRPATGIAPQQWQQVVGKKAKSDLQAGVALHWEQLENA